MRNKVNFYILAWGVVGSGQILNGIMFGMRIEYGQTKFMMIKVFDYIFGMVCGGFGQCWCGFRLVLEGAVYRPPLLIFVEVEVQDESAFFE